MRKKLLLITFMLILAFSLFPLTVNAASDYLYLNNLEFNVQINSDGSMNVTEMLQINLTY